MTDLMKRYEAREGRPPTIFIKEFGYLFTDSFVTWLALENAELKAQLTWRPVSEKPEKADMYFVECKPYTGCGSTIVTTAWFDGEKFPWHDVVKWLPIPPAPEGEAK